MFFLEPAVLHIKDVFFLPLKNDAYCNLCQVKVDWDTPQQNVLFFQSEFGRCLCSLDWMI